MSKLEDLEMETRPEDVVAEIERHQLPARKKSTDFQIILQATTYSAKPLCSPPTGVAKYPLTGGCDLEPLVIE